MDLVAGPLVSPVAAVVQGDPEGGGQSWRGTVGLCPGGSGEVEQRTDRGDVEVEGDSGQAVGPGGGVPDRLGSQGADQQFWSTRLVGRWADGAHGVHDLLAVPHPAHEVDPVGQLRHGARGEVDPRGPVVLLASTHPQGDAESSPAELVGGGQGLGQQHRVVELRHDHRGGDPDPGGPGRDGTQQGEGLGVVEGHPFPEAHRGERAGVDGPRPGFEHLGPVAPQVGLHHGQGQTDLHGPHSGRPGPVRGCVPTGDGLSGGAGRRAGAPGPRWGARRPTRPSSNRRPARSARRPG